MQMLMIDNHDSFVYNIRQYYESVGVHTRIVSNDSVTVRDVKDADLIVISPGPGNPENTEDTGKIEEMSDLTDKKVLGICFGHQFLGMILGSRIRKSGKPMHGEIDRIRHYGGSLYEGVPDEFKAVRYHSLVIEPADSIIIDAVSVSDHEIMGFHSSLGALYGVQYHPESFYTRQGKVILKNFLRA